MPLFNCHSWQPNFSELRKKKMKTLCFLSTLSIDNWIFQSYLGNWRGYAFHQLSKLRTFQWNLKNKWKYCFVSTFEVTNDGFRRYLKIKTFNISNNSFQNYLKNLRHYVSCQLFALKTEDFRATPQDWRHHASCQLPSSQT